MNTTMTKVNKAMHLALDSIVVGDFTTASVAMVAAIQLAQEAEDNLIRGALVVNHEFDEQGFKDAADATIPKVREALDAD